MKFKGLLDNKRKGSLQRKKARESEDLSSFRNVPDLPVTLSPQS